MNEENTRNTLQDGIIATLGYAPLVIGAGEGIEAIKVAEAIARERGFKVGVVGESEAFPISIPPEFKQEELELKITSIRNELCEYKDGKASRRERRANERKQKRNLSNGA